MNLNEPNDGYPYQLTSSTASTAHAQAISWDRRWQLTWMARTVVLVGLILLSLTGVACVVLYRAARQAWSIAYLERCGCSITYLHQRGGGKDFLPADIRSRLPDPWWGDVCEVSIYDGLGYWEGFSF